MYVHCVRLCVVAVVVVVGHRPEMIRRDKTAPVHATPTRARRPVGIYINNTAISAHEYMTRICRIAKGVAGYTHHPINAENTILSQKIFKAQTVFNT